MERGILLAPDVQQLLEGFELFEVYTDEPDERQYAAAQNQITGLNVNPHYIVLHSESQLFVAQSSFTNSKADFKAFLEKGLENRPAFASWLRHSGLEIREARGEVTVATLAGRLESDDGHVATYRDEPVGEYRSTFQARQAFELEDDLEPGAYVIRTRLFTALYRGDEYLETVVVEVPLRFNVVGR